MKRSLDKRRPVVVLKVEIYMLSDALSNKAVGTIKYLVRRPVSYISWNVVVSPNDHPQSFCNGTILILFC